MRKSALHTFVQKYIIDGKPKIKPFDYFAEKATQIKEFLRNHRNIKIRMKQRMKLCELREYK